MTDYRDKTSCLCLFSVLRPFSCPFPSWCVAYSKPCFLSKSMDALVLHLLEANRTSGFYTGDQDKTKVLLVNNKVAQGLRCSIVLEGVAVSLKEQVHRIGVDAGCWPVVGGSVVCNVMVITQKTWQTMVTYALNTSSLGYHNALYMKLPLKFIQLIQQGAVRDIGSKSHGVWKICTGCPFVSGHNSECWILLFRPQIGWS